MSETPRFYMIQRDAIAKPMRGIGALVNVPIVIRGVLCIGMAEMMPDGSLGEPFGGGFASNLYELTTIEEPPHAPEA